MKNINLTNAGLILGAGAVFYVIYKATKWNSAMNSLSYNYDKVEDSRKQYAPQWSDRYDWMNGVEKQGKITYA